MKKIQLFFELIISGMQSFKMYFFSCRKDRFGYLAPTAFLRPPMWGNKKNVFIYENCAINGFFTMASQRGVFIMKRNCSVGPGLTVITANHNYSDVGIRPETNDWGIGIPDKVIVNEDVWIGANVTLCPGVVIGRGSIVAAGSICVKSKSYPPYSIIGGNPAKFIKFRLCLEDQIKQEKLFYSDKEMIEISTLTENYMIYSKKNDKYGTKN